jgi:Zn-dependent M16 (insulinase) family peptidase
MKKFVSLVLAQILLFTLLTSASAASPLPAVGDEVCGFTVSERGVMEIIGSETVLFTHNKTGGLVLYIASEDPNCSFDISFKTPAENNMGVPHVFEHICISGSKKYPSQSLFFPVANQTYNTYVNAMTYNNMTTYPVQSLSEDQLCLLADFYLDGVFNPLVYTEPRLFDREAWRYELPSPDSPLTITGTVYNEMRGSYNINSAAYYNNLDTLFPGSIVSNVSGGRPDSIPDLTRDELLRFHESYYHPSNALVVLYGVSDYRRFLTLIGDGYFSAYDKKEISVESGQIPPRNGTVEKDYFFPSSTGTDGESRSIISYSFAANGASTADAIGLSMLSSVLTHPASPLMQGLRSALPEASLSAYCSQNYPVPYLCFETANVSKQDKSVVVKVIDKALELISKTGIDKSITDAILASEQFSNLTVSEQPDLGVNLSTVTALMWASGGGLDYFNTYLKALDEAKSNEDYFTGLCNKYLSGNPHRAISVTSPLSGAAEEADEKLARELSLLKSSMSEEELGALVKKTRDFYSWTNEKAPKRLLESLQAVKVRDLPEEIQNYPIDEKKIDELTVMTCEAGTGDIGMTVAMFDASGVARSDLHFLKLYTSLIGSLGTEKYSTGEAQTLITKHLGSFSIGLETLSDLSKNSDNYTPVLTARWLSLNEDFKVSAELAGELLFKTVFEDKAQILNVVGRMKTIVKESITASPYACQSSRALATASEEAAYASYISGVEYYKFLIGAEKELSQDPELFISRLKYVQNSVSTRVGAKILYASNKSGIAAFNENVHLIYSGLGSLKSIPANYSSLPAPTGREALIVDSPVQYNLLYSSLDDAGLKYSGKLLPLSKLIYDSFLTPRIRHSIGAYDNIVKLDSSGLMLISYRDPSINETYSVYSELSQFARSAEITHEDIDRYILGVYSSYCEPAGQLGGAVGAMLDKLQGLPEGSKLKTMREIKSFNLGDLRRMSPVFEKLSQDGFKSTGGGKAMIEKNISLFESVIDIDKLPQEIKPRPELTVIPIYDFEKAS